jgi:hypothetical protein
VENGKAGIRGDRRIDWRVIGGIEGMGMSVLGMGKWIGVD